jgi:hypothetical protein
MRELEDQQRKGEVTRYCERATLLEKALGWWKTQVFGRTAQHHSSEVSVDQKMLFSETEVLAAMESADYVFARRLFGDHLRPPVGVFTGTCKLVRFDVHNFEKVSWIPSPAKRAKTDGSSLVRPVFKPR